MLLCWHATVGAVISFATKSCIVPHRDEFVHHTQPHTHTHSHMHTHMHSALVRLVPARLLLSEKASRGSQVTLPRHAAPQPGVFAAL